eukprot:756824-Hanusia_phi.AAC.2
MSPGTAEGSATNRCRCPGTGGSKPPSASDIKLDETVWFITVVCRRTAAASACPQPGPCHSCSRRVSGQTRGTLRSPP